MSHKIAVVGLGYVGLPLALALARKHAVIGFDIDAARVRGLREGVDSTCEVDREILEQTSLTVSDRSGDMAGCDIIIVTVPTPTDKENRPDFRPLLSACATVGEQLTKGAIVVFESTVYPGATEEICGPALEHASGLKSGIDFKLGYSPERINPGDREHTIDKITKIVAGQDEETASLLTDLYGSITAGGIHKAPSIQVAEAAKVIENTQRDLNIALMNELAKICDLLGIATSDVLAAARTKWNFLPFYPGLVGGHCIGVDPYYLTAKAEQLGYQPEVILAGRRINGSMGAFVAQKVVKLLASAGRQSSPPRVGILGVTFKEDVADVRNSRVVDICRELREFGIEPIVHDPHADQAHVVEMLGAEASKLEAFRGLDAVILAVAHGQYKPLYGKIGEMVRDGGVVADVRSALDRSTMRDSVTYWSL